MTYCQIQGWFISQILHRTHEWPRMGCARVGGPYRGAPHTHSRDRWGHAKPPFSTSPPFGFPPRPFMKWRRDARGGRGPGPAPWLCKGRAGGGAWSRAGPWGCCGDTDTRLGDCLCWGFMSVLCPLPW